MAILIGDKIKKALENNLICIEPLDDSQIGPGSVDLSLGNDFRIFEKHQDVYHIKDDSHFQDVTRAIHIDDGCYNVINPGEMILGITKEKITLSESISGRLEGRSRFARFGLTVHVIAGFMQPGISNQQVLEIVNLGHTPIALYPGTRICQFVFEECKGQARYQGQFAKQEKP